MNIMPMSYYPMPSDANSQINVLEESKSDVNNQMQDVTQSNLSETQKTAMTDNLQSKNDQIGNDIKHKEVEINYNNKQQAATTQKQRVEKSEINQQIINTGENSRSGFDKRA